MAAASCSSPGGGYAYYGYAYYGYTRAGPSYTYTMGRPAFNPDLRPDPSRPAFIAYRLHEAMKGWGTEDQVLVRLLITPPLPLPLPLTPDSNSNPNSNFNQVLIRLLAGIDGGDMAECVQTYEVKYGVPLAVALKDELSGDFRRAIVSTGRTAKVSIAIVSIAIVSIAIVSVPRGGALGLLTSGAPP